MIKTLETSYAGCRFRSRLEARWAVFMDKLGVAWQYEPQGYLVDDQPYLPDFWLPHLETFLEVKGAEPDARVSDLAQGLATASAQRVVVTWGDVPDPAQLGSFGIPGDRLNWMECWRPDGGWDNRHVWCYCPRCGCPGIEYEGRSERIHCTHHQPPGEGGTCKSAPLANKTYTGRDDLVRDAYTAARSARFEHGQSGAPTDLPRQRRRTHEVEPPLIPSREPRRLGDLLGDAVRHLAGVAAARRAMDETREKRP